MADEHKMEPEAPTVAETTSARLRCLVAMGEFGELVCSRSLHPAPFGVDEQPVCLMHSKDPAKQDGPLFDAFWHEFERILNTAQNGVADFERFVFPQLDLAKRRISASCRFNGATFTQDADFNEATFTQDAFFNGATFTQKADFSGATFTQDANFHSATFTQDTDFRSTTFTRNARFFSATFTKNANFIDATFTKSANFFITTFTQDADFRRATFTQDADFSYAIFTKAVSLEGTEFFGTARWEESHFLERADFRQTLFKPQASGTPSAIFALARFAKPGEIVFDDVDLSRVLFRNCDVSGVWFTSSARWGRNGRRKAVIFEETISLDQHSAYELLKVGERDYGAVAQIYQQLKKSYDARLDYWTANEFHFGEMEMKRLAAPTEGRLLWLRRQFHRHLSFVAFYRRASDYGNSYRKPLVWLAAILLFFGLLFPFPGIGVRRSRTTHLETYATAWRSAPSAGQRLGQETRLVGKGVLSAVDTAMFRKSPEYAPAYPWGHVLAIVETLLTSTLFALFLLAIRRQFRR